VKLVWSPLALDRVEHIVNFIALDRPRAAQHWVDGLFDTVHTLAQFPEKGRVVPELGRADIRELIYQGHRVIYRLEPTRIAILTVRHGRRNLDLDEVQIERLGGTRRA
jgi:plasmid stabilization system protein ParE